MKDEIDEIHTVDEWGNNDDRGRRWRTFTPNFDDAIYPDEKEEMLVSKINEIIRWVNKKKEK